MQRMSAPGRFHAATEAFKDWIHGGLRNLRRPKVGIPVAVALLLLVATVVTAAVLIRQDVATTPTAAAGDVIFQDGADLTTIVTAGYGSLSIGSSGTSASLSVTGIPGAASVQLTDILKLTNQDATQGYSVTLTRSAAPVAAITGFTVTVQNAADTVLATWDAASTASSSSFTLAASTSLDISISLTIADGTVPGALTSFTIHFDITPV